MRHIIYFQSADNFIHTFVTSGLEDCNSSLNIGLSQKSCSSPADASNLCRLSNKDKVQHFTPVLGLSPLAASTIQNSTSNFAFYLSVSKLWSSRLYFTFMSVYYNLKSLILANHQLLMCLELCWRRHAEHFPNFPKTPILSSPMSWRLPSFHYQGIGVGLITSGLKCAPLTQIKAALGHDTVHLLS